jgi:hypothetical protein
MMSGKAAMMLSPKLVPDTRERVDALAIAPAALLRLRPTQAGVAAQPVGAVPLCAASCRLALAEL